MNANEIKKGDTFKAVVSYNHGSKNFTEENIYTVQKITAAGNFKVVNEFGTAAH